jgi:hypothetical protein
MDSFDQSRGSTRERTALFRLNIRVVRDLPPLDDFGLDEFRELLWCSSGRLDACRQHFFANARHLQSLVDLGVELPEDLFRCTGWRENASQVLVS